MKIYEEKQFIPLRVADNRQQSKQPLNAKWSNGGWDAFNDIKGGQTNIGLVCKGLYVIDIDHINLTQLKTLISYINDKEINALVSITHNEEKNEYGLHLIFREYKQSDQNKTTAGRITLSGYNADVRAGSKGQIVIQLINYEGNRLENAKKFGLHHDNDLAIDELDTPNEAFKIIKRSKYEDDNEPLSWREGERNKNAMKYAVSIYNANIDKQAFNYVLALQPTMRDFTIEEFNAIWNNLSDKFVPIDEFKGLKPWRTEKGLFNTISGYKLISKEVIKLFNVKYWRGSLYFYDETTKMFVSDIHFHHKRLLELDEDLSEKLRSDILKNIPAWLNKFAPSNDWYYLLNTATKTIDIRNNKSIVGLDQISEEFPIYRLKYDYDPNAYDQRMDEYLNEISNNDEDLRDDILRALASAMIPNNFQRFIIFKGNANSGKSTLTNAFTNIWMINEDVKPWSSIDISNMEKWDRKKLAKSLFNISPEKDNSNFNEKDTKLIKAMTGNDYIDIREMYSDQEKNIQIFSTFLMVSNYIVKFNDKTGAMERRVANIPIEYKPIKEDPNLNDKLHSETATKYLIRLLIEILSDVITSHNGKLDFYSKAVENAKQEAQEEGRPLHNFIVKNYKVEDLNGMSTDTFYKEVFSMELMNLVGEEEYSKLKSYYSNANKLARMVKNDLYPNTFSKSASGWDPNAKTTKSVFKILEV